MAANFDSLVYMPWFRYNVYPRAVAVAITVVHRFL